MGEAALVDRRDQVGLCRVVQRAAALRGYATVASSDGPALVIEVEQELVLDAWVADLLLVVGREPLLQEPFEAGAVALVIGWRRRTT